jgi:hypothetical protein
METQHIALSISAANFMLTWGVALYMYLANKNKATNSRIGELERDMEAKLDAHADRLARVEQDLRHAPTHDDLKRLHARIDDLAGGIRGLEGEFKGANHTLQLIHSYLLHGGKD